MSKVKESAENQKARAPADGTDLNSAEGIISPQGKSDEVFCTKADISGSNEDGKGMCNLNEDTVVEEDSITQIEEQDEKNDENGTNRSGAMISEDTSDSGEDDPSSRDSEADDASSPSCDSGEDDASSSSCDSEEDGTSSSSCDSEEDDNCLSPSGSDDGVEEADEGNGTPEAREQSRSVSCQSDYEGKPDKKSVASSGDENKDVAEGDSSSSDEHSSSASSSHSDDDGDKVHCEDEHCNGGVAPPLLEGSGTQAVTFGEKRLDDRGDGHQHLSEYELLRLQKIERNRQRLMELGLSGFGASIMGKNVQRKKPRHPLAPSAPSRRLPSRTARVPLTKEKIHGVDFRRRAGVIDTGSANRPGPTQKNLKEQKEQKETDLGPESTIVVANLLSLPRTCHICREIAGDLVSCTACNGNFHLDCARAQDPPFPGASFVPDDRAVGFKCSDCVSQRRKRQRCGVCANCMREDCGSCIYCLDKPRFGGRSVLRRSCVLRKCVKMQVCGGRGRLNDGKLPASASPAIVAGRIGSIKGAQSSGSPNQEKQHRNVDFCSVCGGGGELLCCDHCEGAFHLACHMPHISSLPEGEWRCMMCDPLSPTRKGRAESRRALVAVIDSKEWICRVVGPKTTCSVCFDDRGCLLCCDECESAYHLTCHMPRISKLPEDEWICIKCTPFLSTSRKRKMREDKKMKRAKRCKYSKVLLIASVGDKYLACRVVGPRTICTVCSGDKDNEDMLFCKSCDNYYHLNCHEPPLDSKPRGRWKCAQCKDEEIKVRPISNIKPSSKVEPNLKARLSSKGLACTICSKDGDTVICKACDQSYHLQCHIPPLDSRPRGRWKCSKCTQRKKALSKRVPKQPDVSATSNNECPLTSKNKIPVKDAVAVNSVVEEKVFATSRNTVAKRAQNEDNSDECFICCDGGELICCDKCVKSFHMHCHIPALTSVPPGTWECMECTTDSRKKSSTVEECLDCKKACDTNANATDSSLDEKRKPLRVDNVALNLVVVKEKILSTSRKTVAKGTRNEDNSDECFICYDGGELICCDKCVKSFHMRCHIPALTSVPHGLWECMECRAESRKEFSRVEEYLDCNKTTCGPNIKTKLKDDSLDHQKGKPGFVTSDGLYYVTRENETTIKVARKLDCYWRDIVKFNEDRYGFFISSSKFKRGTLLRIPNGYSGETEGRPNKNNIAEESRNKEESEIKQATDEYVGSVPEPGFVSPDGILYSTLNNESPVMLSDKLGCDWHDIVEMNKERYVKLKGSSRFQTGTLLVLPESNNKEKINKLLMVSST